MQMPKVCSGYPLCYQRALLQAMQSVENVVVTSATSPTPYNERRSNGDRVCAHSLALKSLHRHLRKTNFICL
jgi:hypothetical protein